MYYGVLQCEGIQLLCFCIKANSPQFNFILLYFFVSLVSEEHRRLQETPTKGESRKNETSDRLSQPEVYLTLHPLVKIASLPLHFTKYLQPANRICRPLRLGCTRLNVGSATLNSGSTRLNPESTRINMESARLNPESARLTRRWKCE